MQASISLRFRDSQGDHHIIYRGEEMTIGRTLASDITVEDETISRNHARLFSVDGEPFIKDVGSRNGIYLGEEKVDRMPLRRGLVFRLGGVSILVDGENSAANSAVINDDLPQQGVLDSLMIDDWQLDLGKTSVQPSQAQDLGVALKLFKDAAETLLTGSDLEQVAEGAIELALRSLPVDIVFVSLIDDAGELHSVAEKRSEKANPEDAMKLSRTIADQVIQERSAVLIRDTGSMENLSAAHSILQMSILSALCAPLITGDKVLGIIYVDCTTETEPLKKDHLDILSVLGLMVSSALEQVRLTQSGAEEKRRREELSCRLSPNVVDKVIAGEAALGSQDLEISVLFADLVGFTTLSEQLPANAVVELLNALFDGLTREVFAQDGTLDKYVGDALIAFFGAPDLQEDHAKRSVQAAIAMQNYLDKFNLQHPEWPDLQMRIGINSGIATVGDIGSTDRRDYTVIGDTVNTASRLESQVSQPGEVVVGDETARQLDDSIRKEKMEPVPLKGKSRSVIPWKIIRG